MKSDNLAKLRGDRVFLTIDACDIADFATEVQRTASLADYPTAASVEKNVLIYDAAAVIAAASAGQESRRAVLAEICDAFADGPGVVVFKAPMRITRSSTGHRPSSMRSSRRSIAKIAAAATISPSPAPMTASGIRWKSTVSPIPRTLPATTATPSWRWSARPGSVRITR